jgi:hypothetical protein
MLPRGGRGRLARFVTLPFLGGDRSASPLSRARVICVLAGLFSTPYVYEKGEAWCTCSAELKLASTWRIFEKLFSGNSRKTYGGRLYV